MIMPSINLSPLQLYLRHYALETETNWTNPHDASQPSRQQIALERLPKKELSELISSAETALSTGDEASVRQLFRDGHLHFEWRDNGAATRYLTDLLLDAKRLRNRSPT